jgi:23S rRNA (pseudouridine1915-N3)-methyltransferase
VKLRVVWLGRQSASPYEKDVEVYRKRVHRRWPAEDRPIRATGGGRGKDPQRVLRLEADAVMRHVEPGWRFIVLDERGRARTSQEFATELQQSAEDGVDGVVFAIGSDLGLHRDLFERADDRLSLSAMTLPHLVARLLLWEQLFRAVNILGGGAYHRVSVQ